MRKIKERGSLQPRLTDFQGLCFYTGVGENKAREILRESGAAKKIGRRTVIDLRIVDVYIDRLPEAQ
jgi:hypothetical protein